MTDARLCGVNFHENILLQIIGIFHQLSIIIEKFTALAPLDLCAISQQPLSGGHLGAQFFYCSFIDAVIGKSLYKQPLDELSLSYLFQTTESHLKRCRLLSCCQLTARQGRRSVLANVCCIFASFHPTETDTYCPLCTKDSTSRMRSTVNKRGQLQDCLTRHKKTTEGLELVGFYLAREQFENSHQLQCSSNTK